MHKYLKLTTQYLVLHEEALDATEHRFRIRSKYVFAESCSTRRQKSEVLHSVGSFVRNRCLTILFSASADVILLALAEPHAVIPM